MKKIIGSILIAGAMVASAMPLHADHHERTAGQVMDDMSIAARAKLALAEDELTEAHEIDLEVDKDNVQLNGFVESEAQRQRAGEIVASLKGVATVQNNLRIQGDDRTAGEYLDDKVLIASVKAALADDEVAHSLKIDVEANEGVVSLGGHVDTEAERAAAYKAAMTVDGVVKVINNLDVRS